MANKNQPERWQAAVLAAALAIAGSLFLFYKLSAPLSHLLSWAALLHASPAALMGVAAALLWAEQENPQASASSRTQIHSKTGQL